MKKRRLCQTGGLARRSGVRTAREETMKNDRRTFLKTAALAGAAATSGLTGLAAPAAAQAPAVAGQTGDATRTPARASCRRA